MNTIVKLALKLDKLGQYKLADKIAQVMDISQYANNPYTPKDIMNIRKQLVPTDFIGEIYQTQKGDTLIHTSDPKSFAIGLMEFARINKFPNLQQAFDDMANNGATYRGQRISNVPELRELYTRISRTPSALTKQMIEQELRNIVSESVGMLGWQKESNPATYKRQYDPSTGADMGYLANEYMQNISNAYTKDEIIFIEQELKNDPYINNTLKENINQELQKKKQTIK